MANIGPSRLFGEQASAVARIQNRPSGRKPPMMRRYTISYIDQDGQTEDAQRIAPAIPDFELAFSAFARGTLIAAEHGQIAIEDLMPGDVVKTLDGGLQKVRWLGSMTFVPRQMTDDTAAITLSRISTDSFGLGRPMPDLLLGSGARFFSTPPATGSELRGGEKASDRADGDAIFQITPASPVQLFHMAFDAPQVVWANGLECESFKPENHLDGLSNPELRALYMSLFPHLSRSAFGESGLRTGSYGIPLPRN